MTHPARIRPPRPSVDEPRECVVIRTPKRGKQRSSWKRRLVSPMDAIRAIDQAAANPNDQRPINIYRCSNCGGVHAGHEPFASDEERAAHHDRLRRRRLQRERERAQRTTIGDLLPELGGLL